MEISDIKPEMFGAQVYPSVQFHSDPKEAFWWTGLTDEQRRRLDTKLELVGRIACKLAANMLKGTLKYENDKWSLDQWLDFATDDAVDTVNYLFLMREVMDEELRRTIPQG